MKEYFKPYHGLTQKEIFQISDHIHDPMYIVDDALRVVYLDHACCAQYGLEPEQTVGCSIESLPDDIFNALALREALRKKCQISWRVVRPEGSDVLATSNPYFVENEGQFFVVTTIHAAYTELAPYVTPHDEQNALVRRSSGENCSDFVTQSKKMTELLELARRLAPGDVPVLITGASGTGKSKMAYYIHEHSNRSSRPFTCLNCSTLPENLVESELFGYVPYAFTGASPKGKDGLLKQTDGGTLFLDEIAELPLPTQAKLLTVVEQQRFIPIGGTKYQQVDIRIISATNQDFTQLMAEKRFREDLYWRLSAFPIHIPSLSERLEDIQLLTFYYLNLFNQKFGMSKTISPTLLQNMCAHSWNGNVRELRNTIERALIVSKGLELTLEDLFPKEHGPGNSSGDSSVAYPSLTEQLEQVKQDIIRRAAAEYGSSRNVARELNLSQSTAARLMKKYISDS